MCFVYFVVLQLPQLPLLVRQLAVERAQVDVELFGGFFLVAVRRGEDVLDVLALTLLEEALERSVGG